MSSQALPAQRRNGLATASLVLGIVTFVPGMVLGIFGSLFGLAALVLGIIALVQISKDQSSGRGAAIIGIVLGAIGAILAPIFTIAALMILGPIIGNTFSTINSSLLTPVP